MSFRAPGMSNIRNMLKQGENQDTILKSTVRYTRRLWLPCRVVSRGLNIVSFELVPVKHLDSGQTLMKACSQDNVPV